MPFPVPERSIRDVESLDAGNCPEPRQPRSSWRPLWLGCGWWRLAPRCDLHVNRADWRWEPVPPSSARLKPLFLQQLQATAQPGRRSPARSLCPELAGRVSAPLPVGPPCTSVVSQPSCLPESLPRITLLINASNRRFPALRCHYCASPHLGCGSYPRSPRLIRR